MEWKENENKIRLFTTKGTKHYAHFAGHASQGAAKGAFGCHQHEKIARAAAKKVSDKNQSQE